jgi:carbon storage regulator
MTAHTDTVSIACIISAEPSASAEVHSAREFRARARRSFMRVLTRRVNESIRIGCSTTLTILHVRGDQVRIRVNASDDVRVYRQEIISELHQAAHEALSADRNPQSPTPAA